MRSACRRSSSPDRKPSLSWRGGVHDRASFGSDALYEHVTVVAAPDTAGKLCDERESALLGTEIGEAQGCVRVQYDAERDIGEVMALGDHLRADQHTRGRRLEATQDRSLRLAPARHPLHRAWAVAARSASSRKTGKSPSSSVAASSCWRRSVPAPWRATDIEPHVSSAAGPALGGRSGDRRRIPLARCSTSATSHSGQPQTRPHSRQLRKFDQPRRLSNTIALPPRRAHLPQGLGRERVQAGQLVAHVEHLDLR